MRLTRENQVPKFLPQNSCFNEENASGQVQGPAPVPPSWQDGIRVGCLHSPLSPEVARLL